MYPAQHVAGFPQLTQARHLSHVDHAAVVVTDRGAAAGAALLRAPLDGSR